MTMRLILMIFAMAMIGCAPETPEAPESAARWFKGNTHTHTLWSDGDAAPELAASWYVERDYDFLVLSDHNVLSEGERWFPVEADGRLTPERLEALRAKFGDAAVETRTVDGRTEMRLHTLAELRAEYETPGAFLFIQGEEITDGFDGKPVHVNGLNLEEVIEPQGGTSVRDVMQRNVDAVIAQGRRLNRPTLAHINHPNFVWAMTPEDVAAIEGERFFEVYNGHPAVHNYGDADRPGMEALWDFALGYRLTETDLGLLYGLATDDVHNYFDAGTDYSTPGRGWVMVRADTLAPNTIIDALHAGEFYATSGVTLEDFEVNEEAYTVRVDAEPGVRYTTRFIGARRTADGVGPVGEVLFETTDNPAVYPFVGDEVYVRAKVSSSKPHPNPYREGDVETAWLQPVKGSDE